MMPLEKLSTDVSASKASISDCAKALLASMPRWIASFRALLTTIPASLAFMLLALVRPVSIISFTSVIRLFRPLPSAILPPSRRLLNALLAYIVAELSGGNCSIMSASASSMFAKSVPVPASKIPCGLLKLASPATYL